MGQALYRKYRSKRLDEIVGQEHITQALGQALKSGRISHAYLFSGPRGVGKTSIARILAHEINGLPYSDDVGAHLDIIEIDAASNNGVEDVRELRDKVYVAPAAAKYKVYIIDEVHMLSKPAFNALLKTLEEPPAHVVFILATTEAQKLPATIISRTQHFTFKPVSQARAVEHLRYIAEQEHIAITGEALELLAAHGDGSFRDSIGLLDQARSLSRGGKTAIDQEDIRQLLGIAPEKALDSLIRGLSGSGRGSNLLALLGELYGQGLQASAIATQLSGRIRTGLVGSKPVLPVSQSLSLLKQLIEVPASRNPARRLEIILLENAYTSDIAAAVPLPAPEPAGEKTPKTAQAAASAEPQAARAKPEAVCQQEPPTAKAPKKAAPVKAAAHPAETALVDAGIWPQILESVKKEYNTLYGVLRMAQPHFGADTLELQCKFAFHQKRLNEAKNKQIIAHFIKQATGNEVAIVCTHEQPGGTGGSTDSELVAAAASGRATIEAISAIFGGGEVL